MKKILLLVLVVLMNNVYAYDGVTSEFSHAAGGAVIAAAITKVFEQSPDRVLIGFGLSATASFLAESYQYSHNNRKLSSSLLDLGSHAIGSALGAWATDRYLLTPVVSRSYSGVVFSKQF
jgi:hypothetical protein